MTEQQAQALALWIKDHDTRFLANATGAKGAWHVTITDPNDGTTGEPVGTVESYRVRFIDVPQCTPTIREKWERFETAQTCS